MNRKDLLFIANILSCCLIYAQSVESAFHWQSDFPLSVEQQAFSEQFQYVGGTFRTQFITENTAQDAIGGSDIFLTAMDETGAMIWSVTGGSERNDLLEAVAYDDGQVFIAGTYWINAVFDDLILNTVGSPQGIFLISYSETGALQSGISINGQGNKEIRDLAIDQSGNLLLAGSFEGSLIVGDSTLFAAKEQFFLLKFDAAKNLLWARQASQVQGEAKGISLATLEADQIILAGDFMGTLVVGEDSLITDTEDEDIFIVSYTAEGEYLWIREAGGVFPSFVVDVVGRSTDFYVGGNFTGRMTLDENLTIESRGPNENIFLLQYDKDGQALAATSIGDGATENMSSLAMASGQLAIGGFFNNFFQQDGLEIREDASGFSGFVLTFDLEEKRVNTLKALNSNNNLFVQDVSFSSGNQLSIIGDFIGGASLGNFTFDATTFNPFLARLQLQSTSTTSISDTDIQLQSTSEYLYLYYDLPLEKVAIYDLAGRLQIAVTGEKSINVSALMSGLYVVQIVDAEGLSGGQLFFKP